MLKPSSFQWAYNNAPLQCDSRMTRARLAHLIVNWRKNGFPVSRLVVSGAHIFTVKTGGLHACARVSS